MNSRRSSFLRDKLIREIRGQNGVISVGIGQDRGRKVLVIITKRGIKSGKFPKFVDGMPVIVKDLGIAEAHEMY